MFTTLVAARHAHKRLRRAPRSSTLAKLASRATLAPRVGASRASYGDDNHHFEKSPNNSETGFGELSTRAAHCR